MEKDPDYKQAFELAKDIAGDVLEGAMFDAVLNGDERVVTYEEKVTGKYKQKSDVLRIFMLKGLKPQYRDSFPLNFMSGPVTLAITYPPAVPIAEPRTALEANDEAEIISKD